MATEKQIDVVVHGTQFHLFLEGERLVNNLLPITSKVDLLYTNLPSNIIESAEVMKLGKG